MSNAVVRVRPDVCHDLTLFLVEKSGANTPESAVDAYIELFPKVQEAYNRKIQESTRHTSTVVIPK